MESSEQRYILSAERQSIEREELAFQVQLNGRSFLLWNSILEAVDADRRYRIIVHGRSEVHQGCQLLEFLFERMRGQGCTFTESVTEVPEEYEIPFEEIWHTETDSETGWTMVQGHELN